MKEAGFLVRVPLRQRPSAEIEAVFSTELWNAIQAVAEAFKKWLPAGTNLTIASSKFSTLEVQEVESPPRTRKLQILNNPEELIAFVDSLSHPRDLDSFVVNSSILHIKEAFEIGPEIWLIHSI